MGNAEQVYPFIDAFPRSTLVHVASHEGLSAPLNGLKYLIHFKNVRKYINT